MANLKKRSREETSTKENAGVAANKKRKTPTVKPNTSTKKEKPKPHSKKFTVDKLKKQPKPVKLSSKESHAKAKSLRIERRQKDCSHYDVTVEIKKLWEDLRRQDMSKDKRMQLCDKIMTLVRGKERDFVFAHDTTRIFQCLCKYAPAVLRSELFSSLKESVLEMTKSKYSVFFVRSLLRRGTKEEKHFIIGKLMENARRLLTHKTAGPVVEYAYNEYANSQQRLSFSRQFYGPSFMLVSTAKDQPLSEVLNLQPEKKPFILKYMRETLESIIHKDALSYTFVHNLLFEYLTHSDDTDRQALAECLQEHVPHIVHTREGAKAGMYVVWYSSARGRKLIIKQIKPYIEKLLVEEYGHMLLYAIFDTVDDTKLVSKLIVSTIIEKMQVLVDDKYGRHVLHYLLSARDPQCVNKEIRDFLSIGDANPFSKKDSDIRRKELRDEISSACLAYAAEHLDKLMSNGSLKMLLFSILKHASGDQSPLLSRIVTLFDSPYSETASTHVLNDKAMRFCIRKLIQNDTTGSVADQFVDGIKSSHLSTYCQYEQGCYLVLTLLNSSISDQGKTTLVKLLRKHKDAISKLANSTLKESMLNFI